MKMVPFFFACCLASFFNPMAKLPARALPPGAEVTIVEIKCSGAMVIWNRATGAVKGTSAGGSIAKGQMTIRGNNKEPAILLNLKTTISKPGSVINGVIIELAGPGQVRISELPVAKDNAK